MTLCYVCSIYVWVGKFTSAAAAEISKTTPAVGQNVRKLDRIQRLTVSMLYSPSQQALTWSTAASSTGFQEVGARGGEHSGVAASKPLV